MSLYGVIGHPIAHSMSPLMHNDAFRQLGLEHHYEAFDVHPDQLERAIAGVRALGIAGLNVTIPHKVNVMAYLDDVDSEARAIGAVNTIVNESDRLIGYNTDGQGYLRSLLTLLLEPLSEKKVLIIGAGGAARAIVTAIAHHGVSKLSITNRTQNKAKALADHARNFVPADVVPIDAAEDQIDSYDVIINTTSVGMSPNIAQTPLSLNRLQPGTIVSDLIYNPLKTLWLSEAEKRGAIIDNGIGMFVYQGALSFEKWTGVKPDIERMKQTVVQELMKS